MTDKRDTSIKYAPIIIPTLCRYEHFRRCVESLKNNTWAEFTDVYIGLDYPAKESHRVGYERIKEYLQGDFSAFRSFNVIEQKVNIGSFANSRSLVDACSMNHDRYIYAEDDLEFSPDFLQYMDMALQYYEDDESVVAVCGYSYPINWIANSACTVVKQNFNGSAWGRGYWINKRNLLLKYLRPNGLSKDFSIAYRTHRFDKMMDYAVKHYVEFCETGWSGEKGFLNGSTDIAMRIYPAVKDKYLIMPLISKVRNHGYDGSGLYCQQIECNEDGDFCVDNYSFSKQPIDESKTFQLIEDTAFDMKANRDLLNAFDRVSPEEMKDIWKRAKRIALLGRYGGLLFTCKKVVKKAAKLIGIIR